MYEDFRKSLQSMHIFQILFCVEIYNLIFGKDAAIHSNNEKMLKDYFKKTLLFVLVCFSWIRTNNDAG